MWLSSIKPALSVIVPDVHPQYVCEMLEKLFPDVSWEYIDFDDADDDFMLAVSYLPGFTQKGTFCVEIRTGQPLVMRLLQEHEAKRW